MNRHSHRRKKISARVMALSMAAAMAVTVYPVPAFAEEGQNVAQKVQVLDKTGGNIHDYGKTGDDPATPDVDESAIVANSDVLRSAQYQESTKYELKVNGTPVSKRLQDLYEGLVEGEISRESFAAQKKALTAQAEKITRTVLELERKISGSDDGSNAVIELFKSYAGITALTREISIELLHSVTIYPDGRMDIRLNLVDEIEALMEALRRESCTA